MRMELWSRLPSEVVEQVLSFLSVPVLCRFRTVCRSWDSLICNPTFGTLCVRHARQTDACFLVTRYIYVEYGRTLYQPFGKNHGWCFLDLNARRSYTIERDGEEGFDRFETANCVAMDAGFVCQVFGVDPRNDKNVSIFVSNPIAKASRKLPSAPFLSASLCIMDHK